MLKILYEDDDLIVVQKPSGIAVQTRSVAEEDIESRLKKHRRKNGDPSDYIGIVHRLDQPVEGILVFAKNTKAAAVLSEQLRDRDEEQDGSGKTRTVGEKQKKKEGGILKEYRAVVYGKMASEKGTLVDHLKKDARMNRSFVTDDVKDGKRSVLTYEVMSSDEETQTLKIRLKTGRHHQIRVQLAHAGCPILGDTKYKTEGSEHYNGTHRIRQLQLFADHLVFFHPKDGKRMEFVLKKEDETAT